MMEHALATHCWNCGYECNHHSAPGDDHAPPSDGDISVCINCGKLAIFDASMPDKVRRPSPSESIELHQDPEVHQMLIAWYRAKHMTER